MYHGHIPEGLREPHDTEQELKLLRLGTPWHQYWAPKGRQNGADTVPMWATKLLQGEVQVQSTLKLTSSSPICQMTQRIQQSHDTHDFGLLQQKNTC